MSIYKNLFLDNFGEDDLIIMGLNSIEKKVIKIYFLIQWLYLIIN